MFLFLLFLYFLNRRIQKTALLGPSIELIFHPEQITHNFPIIFSFFIGFDDSDMLPKLLPTGACPSTGKPFARSGTFLFPTFFCLQVVILV